MAFDIFHYRSNRSDRCVFSIEGVLGFAALLTSLLLAIASIKPVHQPSTPELSHPAKFKDPTVAGALDKITCQLDTSDVDTNKCIFDQMLNGWLPSQCYNERLANEALRDDTHLALLGGSGQFPWYRDFDFTSPLPATELAEYVRSEAGNMTAYTWEKWHVAHCMYIWRTGQDVMRRISEGETEIYVSDRVLNVGHVNHCNEVIANQDHRVGAKSIVHFGHQKCVRII